MKAKFRVGDKLAARETRSKAYLEVFAVGKRAYTLQWSDIGCDFEYDIEYIDRHYKRMCDFSNALSDIIHDTPE